MLLDRIGTFLGALGLGGEHAQHAIRSRTEETSGLVTTSASSAKYIAMIAPVSMPAGESPTM